MTGDLDAGLTRYRKSTALDSEEPGTGVPDKVRLFECGRETPTRGDFPRQKKRDEYRRAIGLTGIEPFREGRGHRTG
jgi:hypothetical protein